MAPDLYLTDLEPTSFCSQDWNYIHAAYITAVQYFLLDSFALPAAPDRHDQYFCTFLLPSYMRLHALNSSIKGGDGWTAFRPASRDTAITRGDQIRKRNVYCRRRTRLSSFSEIIHPERRRGREEEDHLYGARETYSLERWTANTYACHIGLNNISSDVLKIVT